MRGSTYIETVSAAANGTPRDINQCFSASLVVVGTGTLAGAVKLQYSNDPRGEPNEFSPSPTNWVDIPSATVSLTAAATVGIAKIDVCYNWLRAVMGTPTGTGTAKMILKTNGY